MGLQVVEPWAGLAVGDRVRFVRMPSGVDAPGYTFPLCTRRLYEKLIARGRSVRVYEIDKHGYPWIACKFRRWNGRWHYHSLMIYDDSWVQVRRRAEGPP